jgi:hypothetical protein
MRVSSNLVIKQTKSTILHKPLILVIISFLGVALIFGSSSTLLVFAVKKIIDWRI